MGHERRWLQVRRKQQKTFLPTCCNDRLPVLLFIALIKVVQIADICRFDAHQTGQTLHVFIAVGRTPSLPSPAAQNMILSLYKEVGIAHVAFPSRIKTQESDSVSVASTTLTDSGFSFSTRSVWLGVGLA